MIVDFEYSGEKGIDIRENKIPRPNRISMRKPQDEGHRYGYKENFSDITNISNYSQGMRQTHSRTANASPAPSSYSKVERENIGTSKSYIMAMKALQSKLEEKDKRIRELEMCLRDGNNSLSGEVVKGPRQTAIFGNDRPRVEPLNLNGGNGFGANRVLQNCSTQNHNSCDSLDQNSRRGPISTCRCSDYDNIVSKLEEVQRELDLSKKKLQNQKEQIAQLQESIDNSNKQVASLEVLQAKKDKEVKTLNSALRNMKDLVEIISKKRRNGDIDGFSNTTVPDHTDSVDSARQLENLASFGGNFNRSKEKAQEVEEKFTFRGDKPCLSNTQRNNSRSQITSSETFEAVFSDVLQHILLNSTMGLEQLELFALMKAKLCNSFQQQFKDLEENQEYLRTARIRSLEQAKKVTSPEETDKLLEDVHLLEILSGLCKGLLQLNK
jgi:hypothetical protein